MIRLETSIKLQRPPPQVLEAIFDPDNWLSFEGHGMLPGIAAVEITPGPAGRIGTRFDVTNTDGSTHTETVTEYEPGGRLTLRMDGFSKPLSRFADHFIESWRVEDGVLHRDFELVPKNWLGSMLLRIVRPSMRRAVETQNAKMAAAD